MRAYEAAGLVGKYVEAVVNDHGEDWSGAGLVVMVHEHLGSVAAMFDYGYAFSVEDAELTIWTDEETMKHS